MAKAASEISKDVQPIEQPLCTFQIVFQYGGPPVDGSGGPYFEWDRAKEERQVPQGLGGVQEHSEQHVRI